MTPEERESIIAEAAERALLAIPEVIGNLMSNHALKIRLNREFYGKYPEFKDHKDIVGAVVEAVEGSNTTASYEDILEKAVPGIKNRIKVVGSLDMKSVKRPNLSIGHGDL